MAKPILCMRCKKSGSFWYDKCSCYANYLASSSVVTWDSAAKSWAKCYIPSKPAVALVRVGIARQRCLCSMFHKLQHTKPMVPAASKMAKDKQANSNCCISLSAVNVCALLASALLRLATSIPLHYMTMIRLGMRKVAN